MSNETTPALLKLAETAHHTAANIAKHSGNEANYEAALTLFLAVISATGAK